MKTKTIQRKQARVIADLAIEAIKEALKGDGLDAKISGGIRYGAGSVTFKVEAFLPDRMATRMTDDAMVLGFSDDIIGKTFKIRNTVHTITEIKLSRWKYPISTKTQRGARYKFPAKRVANLLGVTYNGR